MKKQVKKQIRQTPKPYLSYSQLWLVERNPEQYKRLYLLGEDMYVNPAMEFGKEFAKIIQRYDEDSGQEDIERIKAFLPRYPHTEFEIKTEVKDIPLYGKLDGVDLKKRILGEHKTGKTEWTQKAVNENDQITFYYLLLYKRFGWLARRAMLHWIETQARQDGFLVTGKIKTFETTRTLYDLAKMVSRIEEAWRKIQALVKETLEEIGL